jgi:hypothetical protein
VLGEPLERLHARADLGRDDRDCIDIDLRIEQIVGLPDRVQSGVAPLLGAAAAAS